jgi:hypothetical protein
VTMRRFIALVIFGIAFGFLEAIIVTYLRKLFGYEGGYQIGEYRTLLNLGVIAFISPATALISDSFLIVLERLREASTIIILLAVSSLAAKNFQQGVGAFLVTFSLWDIFYYVFLKLLLNWPATLFDIDIYFLLPYVWVGPVITALIISSLLFFVGVNLYLRKT